MPITKGCKALVAEAKAKIRTISVDDAKKKLGDAGVVFVDIRDVRELERDGMIPGAFHAPRGMLEFWVDPDSPYFKDVFGSGKEFVFYCASAWRSALATAVVQETVSRRCATSRAASTAGSRAAETSACCPRRAAPDR